MKTYIIAYTDINAWSTKQTLATCFQEVQAESEQDAIEWFSENVQCDYDDVSEA